MAGYADLYSESLMTIEELKEENQRLKEQQSEFEYNASQIIATKDERIAELEAQITGHKLAESFLKDRIAEGEAK